MRTIIVGLVLLLTVGTASAQYHSGRVVVVNNGWYNHGRSYYSSSYGHSYYRPSYTTQTYQSQIIVVTKTSSNVYKVFLSKDNLWWWQLQSDTTVFAISPVGYKTKAEAVASAVLAKKLADSPVVVNEGQPPPSSLDKLNDLLKGLSQQERDALLNQIKK